MWTTRKRTIGKDNIMITQRFSTRAARIPSTLWVAALLNVVQSPAGALQSPEQVVAFVGVAVIDGNGGPALPDATIIVRGKRIAAVGPRTSVQVPKGARVIDGMGKYVTPGFIDTNVHMSPINGEINFARYWDRLDDLVLQGVQLQLKYGVTSVRDSYGTLVPLQHVRDAIARGKEIGPRMYVAGNIVGFGGMIRGVPDSQLTLFQEQINDLFTQGTGEELIYMTLGELRNAIDVYLDKGPDFIKYGGTTEGPWASFMQFSEDAQKVIVEETHNRGLVAEVHATTPEALRTAILAGVDLIQHPEAVGQREIPDELVRMIVERRIVCSMLPNKYTGRIRQRFLEQRERALRAEADNATKHQRKVPRTSAEVRRYQRETGIKQPGMIQGVDLDLRWQNGQKLIRAGCIVSVGADNLLFGRPGIAPEYLRENHPVPEHLEPGIGTIIAIEGLVELGMTPSQAIVAATKNGAIASKALSQYGTLEVGKFADLLLLDADPLSDIHNIRKLELVVKEGQIVDPATLPIRRVTGEW